MCVLCSKARSAARRAQDEADALKAEAKELKQKADELLQNLRAAEDDVSNLCCSLTFFAYLCATSVPCVQNPPVWWSCVPMWVSHLVFCSNNVYSLSYSMSSMLDVFPGVCMYAHKWKFLMQ